MHIDVHVVQDLSLKYRRFLTKILYFKSDFFKNLFICTDQYKIVRNDLRYKKDACAKRSF